MKVLWLLRRKSCCVGRSTSNSTLRGTFEHQFNSFLVSILNFFENNNYDKVDSTVIIWDVCVHELNCLNIIYLIEREKFG